MSDPKNPIGKGFADPKVLDGTPAHRIEYLDPSETGRPAGFGAIAPHWSPRREFAGTYDEAWNRSRRPLLPVDYDQRFALSSPDDQRPEKHLRGGEPVELVNLTPSGLLQFELPKVYPTFRTFIRGKRHEHRAKLGTVLLEPDLLRVSMVWQTALPVNPRDVDYLDETTISEKRYLR